MSVECNISENVSLPPILMFHGTKDLTINPKVSVVVYEALKKYNKDVKLYLLEGADHGGSEFFSDNVLDIIEEFCKRLYQLVRVISYFKMCNKMNFYTDIINMKILGGKIYGK